MTMAITLNWSNRGQQVNSVKIYRNTQRKDAPMLLAILDTPAETYVDETTATNTLYFYRVNLVIGEEEIPGAIIPMLEAVNTGPGPETLAVGTWEWGYFGTLNASEFFTASNLTSTITITYFSAWTGGTLSIWRKYAVSGKVIYVPDAPVWIGSNTQTLYQLNAIYAAGMLYGHGKTDKIAQITASPTLQNKTISKDGYEFLIRAPKANYDTDPTTTYYTSSSIQTDRSEVCMILGANRRIVSAAQITAGVGFPSVTIPTTANASYNYCLVQNMYNTQYALTFKSTSTSVSLDTQLLTGNTSLGFFPVLELVMN